VQVLVTIILEILFGGLLYLIGRPIARLVGANAVKKLRVAAPYLVLLALVLAVTTILLPSSSIARWNTPLLVVAAITFNLGLLFYFLALSLVAYPEAEQ
jgi:hypothetical protein